MIGSLRPFVFVAVITAFVFAGQMCAATVSNAPAQFLNISTRGFVQTGDRVIIGGFIITGSAGKHLLVRGLGPSLREAGLVNVLGDPVLELRDANGTLLLSNDNWKETQQAEIEQTGLAPHDPREAAILTDLPAGGHYTGILRGVNNGTGIALIEIYDLSADSASLLANVSTRGFVDAGDRAMIGGFILGHGTDAARVIARGIGPSLGAAGVKDSLPDPTFELHSSTGAVVATNNNWKDTQQSAIEFTGIPPADDLESAIVAVLPPGGYTAILRDHADVAGTALVELYDLNANGAATTVFSFENGLEGWVAKATDITDPPVYWSIEPSQDRAADGSTSLKYVLENLNDAGKIWIERGFAVQPNQPYHVTVQFSFATADWGDVNHWPIIIGVRTEPAFTRNDLTYRDSTANGESSDVGFKWLEKRYDFDIASAANGTLYVDLGVWGTWETLRTYYVDNVRVTITGLF